MVYFFFERFSPHYGGAPLITPSANHNSPLDLDISPQFELTTPHSTEARAHNLSSRRFYPFHHREAFQQVSLLPWVGINIDCCDKIGKLTITASKYPSSVGMYSPTTQTYSGLVAKTPLPFASESHPCMLLFFSSNLRLPDLFFALPTASAP